MAEEEENPYPVAPGASYIESKFPPWNVERVVDELGELKLDGKPAARAFLHPESFLTVGARPPRVSRFPASPLVPNAKPALPPISSPPTPPRDRRGRRQIL